MGRFGKPREVQMLTNEKGENLVSKKRSFCTLRSVPKLKKPCKFCGKEFEAIDNRIIYCSEVCRHEAWKAQMREVMKRQYRKLNASFKAVNDSLDKLEKVEEEISRL